MHFSALERLGLRCAAISELHDGDCGWAESARLARDRFLAKYGLQEIAPLGPRQVHGAKVLVLDDSNRGRSRAELPEADAVLTSIKGLPVAITVADCVPVFLFDPVRGAGGLVHAGRAGTLLDISGAAVRRLVAEWHGDASNVRAVIGPSAGPCCYEVSEDMAADFGRRGLPHAGRKLDLWEANREQLHAAGIPLAQITVSRICTICGGRFHSHRAQGGTARNLALLVL